jgi:hypothetical protein
MGFPWSSASAFLSITSQTQDLQLNLVSIRQLSSHHHGKRSGSQRAGGSLMGCIASLDLLHQESRSPCVPFAIPARCHALRANSRIISRCGVVGLNTNLDGVSLCFSIYTPPGLNLDGGKFPLFNLHISAWGTKIHLVAGARSTQQSREVRFSLDCARDTDVTL